MQDIHSNEFYLNPFFNKINFFLNYIEIFFFIKLIYYNL